MERAAKAIRVRAVKPTATASAQVSRRRRRVHADLAFSLLGSILPAFVGAAGTFALTAWAPPSVQVAMLSIWTVVGFLSLSDLGMTRSASRLVAEGRSATDDIVRALWRVAVPLGVVIGLGLVGVASALRLPEAAYLLALLPLAALPQFACIGALEAQGRFLQLAVQRLFNAGMTYLIPVLATMLLPEPAGMWTGVCLIVGYRVGSLLVLSRIAGLRPAHLFGTIYSRRARTGVNVHGILTWIAISSVIGPAFLYADRLILAAAGVPADFWVFYTATSELLMKTYVIPSAILSVVFPWLISAIWRNRRRVSTIFVTVVPVLTFASAGIGVLAALYVPDTYFEVVGIDPSAVASARPVLGMLLVGTIVNWSSQFYIALNQVVGHQRFVAIAQIVLVAPFVLGMIWAVTTNAELGVPFVSMLRVLVLCVVLWILGIAALRSLPISAAASRTQATPD